MRQRFVIARKTPTCPGYWSSSARKPSSSQTATAEQGELGAFLDQRGIAESSRSKPFMGVSRLTTPNSGASARWSRRNLHLQGRLVGRLVVEMVGIVALDDVRSVSGDQTS